MRTSRNNVRYLHRSAVGSGTYSDKQGQIRLHVAVLLFSLAALLADHLSLGAVAITMSRSLLAVLFLLPVWLLRRHARQERAARPSLVIYLLSGSLLALHWILFFDAVIHGGVSLALMAYASFPLASFLLDRFNGSWPVPRVEWLAMILTLAGVALLSGGVSLTAEASGRGLLSGIASGVLFALLAAVNGRWLSRIPAMEKSLAQLLVAGLLLLPFSWKPLLHLPLPEWLVLLALALFSTAMGHSLFISALPRVSLALSARVAALEPFYGLLLAFLLVGSTPAAHEWIALPFLLMGALLSSNEKGSTSGRPLDGCT